MTHRRSRAVAAAWGGALLLATGMAAGPPPVAAGDAPARQVHVLEVEGVIGPLTERYVGRELAAAEREGAEAVVIRLDTPGGLEQSMRNVVEEMLASPVPVVVHVAPPGARAASAGMFITIAAHVATMAPGTNIGSAHPVPLGGDTDEVMASKVVNDAAALARALASRQGRNAEWAERAVRESVSVTASEARELGVIDLVVEERDELLRAIDGRQVTVRGGTETLDTAGAAVVERGMSLPERILQALLDPNIAYILLTLGVIGIMAEIYSPGSIFPGVTGVVALLLAFTALGSLPVNWAGVALLLIAAGLLVFDLLSEGFGALGVGAVILFVLASVMLFQPFEPVSPALPSLRVSPWLIVVMAAVAGGFLLLVGRSVLKIRKVRVRTGEEWMVGRTARASSDLAPMGRVEIDREEWTAVADRGEVHAGDAVRVTGIDGVTLHVEPAPGGAEDRPPA